MKSLKSIILPILGIGLVFVFAGLAYVSQSPFLKELLSCGFILSLIFGIRMSEILQQENTNKENLREKQPLNGSLLKTELKKEQWQY